MFLKSPSSLSALAESRPKPYVFWNTSSCKGRRQAGQAAKQQLHHRTQELLSRMTGRCAISQQAPLRTCRGVLCWQAGSQDSAVNRGEEACIHISMNLLRCF
jgi:hypothetical protein